MKSIKNYYDVDMINSPSVITQQFQNSVYNISIKVLEYVNSKLIVGKTVVLFSGFWRFDIDAIYLESKIFKDSLIPLKEKIYFVEHNKHSLPEVMKTINASNVLILHSAIFCNYQSPDKLIEQVTQYQSHTQQILLSVPQERVSFNRLKYSAQDIAEQYQAQLIDNSFVFQTVAS